MVSAGGRMRHCMVSEGRGIRHCMILAGRGIRHCMVLAGRGIRHCMVLEQVPAVDIPVWAILNLHEPGMCRKRDAFVQPSFSQVSNRLTMSCCCRPGTIVINSGPTCKPPLVTRHPLRASLGIGRLFDRCQLRVRGPAEVAHDQLIGTAVEME